MPLVVLLLLAPLAMAFAHQVHHAAKQSSKEQIELLEEQWRDAVMKDDVGLMDKLLADDYVGISMTGQVNTKEMQLDRLRSRSLAITRMDLSDVKVKLIGSVAIVTSLAQLDGTNDGLSMHGTFRYTRIYERTPNGSWKITSFEATRVPQGGDRGVRQQRGLNGPASIADKP